MDICGLCCDPGVGTEEGRIRCEYCANIVEIGYQVCGGHPQCKYSGNICGVCEVASGVGVCRSVVHEYCGNIFCVRVENGVCRQVP